MAVWQSVRGYLSRREDDLSREIREPRRPRLRRYLAPPMLLGAVWATYYFFAAPPPEPDSAAVFRLVGFAGSATIMMGVAYLLPKSLDKLATVLLAVSRAALLLWLALFAVFLIASYPSG